MVTVFNAVRRGIAGACIHQPERRVVGESVPGGATTAAAPVVFLGPTGDRRGKVGLVLISERGIARHGVKAPAAHPRSRVVGGQGAPGLVEVRPAMTDYDEVAGQQRRARDRIVIPGACVQRVDLPP